MPTEIEEELPSTGAPVPAAPAGWLGRVPVLLALLAVPSVAAVVLLGRSQATPPRATLGAPAPTAAMPAALAQRAPAAPVGLFQLAPDIVAGTPAPHADRGACNACHRFIQPGTPAPAAPAALTTPATQPPALLASPALPLQSVRWAGLEAVALGPRLASVLGTPAGSGVLLMTLTGRASSSGLAPGDVVTAIDGRPTPDLLAFARAAEASRAQARCRVEVFRRSVRLGYSLEGGAAGLGSALGRVAPSVDPGSTPPHDPRGACASCHPILGAG